MTQHNHRLGQFNLMGIPPAPRGTPQIEVTFDVDSNGILNVSAVEKAGGKMEKITITNDKGRLSKEEIDRMVEESEKFKADDDKQKQRIDAKNGLESYCFNMKSTVDEANIKDKVPESDREMIVTKCNETIAWLERNQMAEVEEFKDKQKGWKLLLIQLFRNCMVIINLPEVAVVVHKVDRVLELTPTVGQPLKKLIKIFNFYVILMIKFNCQNNMLNRICFSIKWFIYKCDI